MPGHQEDPNVGMFRQLFFLQGLDSASQTVQVWSVGIKHDAANLAISLYVDNENAKEKPTLCLLNLIPIYYFYQWTSHFLIN